MDTKKGFLWAIFIWSLGACIHALCGIATSGLLTGEWFVGFEGARETISKIGDTSLVASTSVTLFIIARVVLAIGESGNFPAAIKTTAEYFPKKDRGFATSIFNAGATIGALLAPLTIPFIADAWGWEAAFVVIGALGFIWMGFWVFMYDKPHKHRKVNQSELDYINQDDIVEQKTEVTAPIATDQPDISFAKLLQYKQTWAFAVGKFMTDGVWWFYLFWIPAYLHSVYGLSATESAPLIFVLYLITLLSIVGGWLPTYFVEKKNMDPYAGRMRSMLIFAFFPLLALFAQPLGTITVWLPVIIIGIAGAAHQAWSANIFSTIGDMFPKSAIATVTGIGGMAGGVGAFFINKGSGMLFDYSAETNMQLLGFEGVHAGYFIIFSICAVAYLVGWIIMKTLVPKMKLVKL
jgi:ACS family hexuronate transporter-like MFS transporter